MACITISTQRLRTERSILNHTCKNQTQASNLARTPNHLINPKPNQESLYRQTNPIQSIHQAIGIRAQIESCMYPCRAMFPSYFSVGGQEEPHGGGGGTTFGLLHTLPWQWHGAVVPWEHGSPLWHLPPQLAFSASRFSRSLAQG